MSAIKSSAKAGMIDKNRRTFLQSFSGTAGGFRIVGFDKLTQFLRIRQGGFRPFQRQRSVSGVWPS